MVQVTGVWHTQGWVRGDVLKSQIQFKKFNGVKSEIWISNVPNSNFKICLCPEWSCILTISQRWVSKNPNLKFQNPNLKLQGLLEIPNCLSPPLHGIADSQCLAFGWQAKGSNNFRETLIYGKRYFPVLKCQYSLVFQGVSAALFSSKVYCSTLTWNNYILTS